MRSLLSGLVFVAAVTLLPSLALAEDSQLGEHGFRYAPSHVAAPSRGSAPYHSDWRKWHKRRGGHGHPEVPELSAAAGAQALALLAGVGLLVANRRRRACV